MAFHLASDYSVYGELLELRSLYIQYSPSVNTMYVPCKAVLLCRDSVCMLGLVDRQGSAGTDFTAGLNATMSIIYVLTARCTIAQSAVLRLHVVCLSVCDVGGSGAHRFEILETNCTHN